MGPTINIVLLSCKNTSCASHKSLKMTSVFVGNIPYGVTEDQLKDIFGEAGSVVSFRIVHDRETGRSKGFGFCEYQDPSSAQNAMRTATDTSLTAGLCELTLPTEDRNAFFQESSSAFFYFVSTPTEKSDELIELKQLKWRFSCSSN